MPAEFVGVTNSTVLFPYFKLTASRPQRALGFGQAYGVSGHAFQAGINKCCGKGVYQPADIGAAAAAFHKALAARPNDYSLWNKVRDGACSSHVLCGCVCVIITHPSPNTCMFIIGPLDMNNRPQQLGATLANSQRSEEALPAYQR